MSTICIYHGPNCLDGFAAAWVFNRYAKQKEIDVEYVVGIYQSSPPDVTGKNVYLLDFSYKKDVLLEMASKANMIYVLDHHKTALEELYGLPENVNFVFDMDSSGAMIAWNYFFPDEKTPEIINHIQDRDLWKFELKDTKKIIAAVASYDLDFEVWDDLIERYDKSLLIIEGETLLRKQEKDIETLIRDMAFRKDIAGYDVPVINIPSMFASDVGNIMSIGEPFAASYYDVKDGRIYSLRSQPEGIDVSEIAKAMGGGGHKHAAGFKITSF